jgi:hypothetical protein
MRADPLLSEKPSERPVSLFILAGGAIRFLVPPAGPKTVAELREAEAERAQQDEAAAVAKFRASQPQVTLSWADLRAVVDGHELTRRSREDRGFGGGSSAAATASASLFRRVSSATSIRRTARSR